VSSQRRRSLEDINGRVSESSTLAHITNVTIEWRHEYVLSLVAKKKVAAATASVLSTEAFPMVVLALQLKVPMVVASIPSPKVGEECWNSGLDTRLKAVTASIHLEEVAATSESVQLRETLPMTSWVLDQYENSVT
jgi:hypothetical protein